MESVLNHAWSIDEAQVYFRGKPLKHAIAADTATFETLDAGLSVGSNGSGRYLGYTRDARKVYYADDGGSLRAIAGADPQSFVSAATASPSDHRRRTGVTGTTLRHD